MDPHNTDVVAETRVTVWPASRPWGERRRALLGAGFVVLVLVLLSASIGSYRGWFTPTAWVTLTADHTGLQLDPRADVKLHGVLVGEVRSVDTDGSHATLRLALDPDQLPHIPANVTALLLPKTLFGQKYVELTPPADPSPRALTAGATIHQERGAGGVELERVVDDLLPVLRAVPPDRLSSTLTALADALRNRGERIGDTLTTLDHYLATLNRQLPTLKADIRKLGTVLETYTGALPDLLTILGNVTVTATTVTEQRTNLTALLNDTTDAADTVTPFLLRHEGRLVQLGQVSRPLLDVLAEYAPEYPCLTTGMVNLQKNIEGAFDTGRLHISLEITRDSGKYLAGDEPVDGADIGPRCWGLPDNPPVPAPEAPLNDGYDRSSPHGGLVSGLPQVPIVNVPDIDAGTGGMAGGAAMGYAGTPEERSVVDPLVAAATGSDVTDLGDITDLLWGPMMRGAVVSAH